jgi:acyl carrier protein
VALDEKLGIEIPEQDYGKTSTMKSLLSYIKNGQIKILIWKIE